MVGDTNSLSDQGTAEAVEMYQALASNSSDQQLTAREETVGGNTHSNSTDQFGKFQSYVGNFE